MEGRRVCRRGGVEGGGVRRRRCGGEGVNGGRDPGKIGVLTNKFLSFFKIDEVCSRGGVLHNEVCSQRQMVCVFRNSQFIQCDSIPATRES